MEYYYQGKTGATATFSISKEQVETQILNALKTEDTVSIVCDISAHDATNNHISSGFIEWQIKEWKKVKTEV